MKPLSSCALFGATRALAGIKDALCLQHSVVGCHWGSLAFRYAGKPYEVMQASTVVYENDVIEGGEQLLTKAVNESRQLFPNSKAIFVVSGCVPNMIGDDTDGILASLESKKKLLHIKAPGYVGNIDTGIENAYLSLLALMQAPSGEKSRLPSVNLLGIMEDDPYAANDLKELLRCFQGKLRVNCSLSDCHLADIERMPSADLNVCFGYGEPLAKKLRDLYDLPYISCPYPYGVAGLEGFLEQLGDILKIDFSCETADLEGKSKKLVYECAEYLNNIYNLPAVIVADKAHLAGMSSFLENELGMNIVLAKDSAEYTLDMLELELDTVNASLLCGSSFLYRAAAKRNLPLLRFTYPMYDRICLTGSTMVGAKGAGFIIEQIVNSALQMDYKSDGIYAPLRDAICEARP